MGPYDPTELPSRLIDQLEKGREFSRSGGQKIADAMIVSKGINLPAPISTFKKNSRECLQQSIELKTWAHFNIFSHRSHQEKRIVITTTVKGGYTVMVYNIYGVPPQPPEEPNEAIDSITHNLSRAAEPGL